MSFVNPDWLVWLIKIMTLQAEHLLVLHPFSFKNTFCAGTLFCPAMIALEKNYFMTSQHDPSFNNTHRLYSGLHVELVVGSSATHQKSLTIEIITSK